MLEERAELVRSDLRTASQKKDQLEKEYEDIISGGMYQIIPFFLRLSTQQKACVLSFLPSEEIRRVIEGVVKLSIAKQLLWSL